MSGSNPQITGHFHAACLRDRARAHDDARIQRMLPCKLRATTSSLSVQVGRNEARGSEGARAA